MGFYSRCLISLVLLVASVRATLQWGHDERYPEQVHVSIGESTDEHNERHYVVTWTTLSPTQSTSMQYGYHPEQLNIYSQGTQERFVDGGSLQREIFIHRVNVTLSPNSDVYYQVGDDELWSDKVYQFHTLPMGSDWSPRIIVYGDLGVENAKSIPYLMNVTAKRAADLILHVGDFAYDMKNNDGKLGDEFMRMLEPVASAVPYMTCPGNHESAYNFSHHRNRFSMPTPENGNFFHSFNVGPAHVVAFTAEFYYYVQYGTQQIRTQFQWLEQDLKVANLPENRAARPWIIAFGHRPMYCSNLKNTEHCLNIHNYARVGVPFCPDGSNTSPHETLQEWNGRDFYCTEQKYYYGLESLFYQYGVDLVFYGHEHSYERMWPVFNLTVCNGSDPHNPYRNPPAPVHVVTGAAGNKEGVYPFVDGGLKWSAFRSDDYGYSVVNIVNKTHLIMEQISVDKGGEVIDRMEYIRDRHGAEFFACV